MQKIRYRYYTVVVVVVEGVDLQLEEQDEVCDECDDDDYDYDCVVVVVILKESTWRRTNLRLKLLNLVSVVVAKMMLTRTNLVPDAVFHFDYYYSADDEQIDSLVDETYHLGEFVQFHKMMKSLPFRPLIPLLMPK